MDPLFLGEDVLRPGPHAEPTPSGIYGAGVNQILIIACRHCVPTAGGH